MESKDESSILYQVRSTILSRIKISEIDGRDIERIKNDDWFIERFIQKRRVLGEEITIKSIVDPIMKTLKWRQEFGVNDIRTDLIPREFYDVRGVSVGMIGDNVIAFTRAKNRPRISEWNDVMIDHIVHSFEHSTNTYHRSIISVVDCSGIGIMDTDMSLSMHIAPILSKNYPSLMKTIYYHNMPSIVVPLYQTFKSLIPKKYRMMVTLTNDDNLCEILGGKKNLPPFLGGSLTVTGMQMPPDCRSIEEVGKARNISDANILKMRKFFDSIENE